MIIAFLFAVVMNFVSYWFSDKIVLKMYNAQEVDDSSAPQFVGMVRELAQRAQIPMPKVYLIDEAAPNAFATGAFKNSALVAVSTGLLRGMTREEVMANVDRIVDCFAEDGVFCLARGPESVGRTLRGKAAIRQALRDKAGLIPLNERAFGRGVEAAGAL